MTKKLIKLSLIATSALMLGSCGGESDLTAAGGTLSSGGVTAMLSTTAFSSLLDSMQSSGAGNISAPISGLPTGVGLLAGEFDTCKTETGSKTDGADGDGIPESFRQEFNCNGIAAAGGGTNDFVGYYSVKDYDNTKHGWAGGYIYDFSLTYANNLPHETNTGKWGGIWSVIVGSTTLTTTGHYYNEGGSVSVAEPEKKSVWRYTNKSTVVLTPTSMTTPWQAGKSEVNGFYGLSGTFYYQATSTSYALDVVFEVKSTDLTYDRVGCPGGHFKSGSLAFTDGGGNVLKYTWVNCTQTRTFNGTTI